MAKSCLLLSIFILFVWLDVEHVAWQRLSGADAKGVALKKLMKFFIGRGIQMPMIVGLTAVHPQRARHIQ